MRISDKPGSNRKLQVIYWFAYYNFKSPSVRYRALYPLENLRNKYGIKSTLVIPGYSIKRILIFIRAFFLALFSSEEKAAIVIQRIHSNFIYANLLKLLIKIKKYNTIYDIDDADYLEIPSKTIFFFIKNCSAVFVGSNELASYLSKFNSHIILNTSPTPDLGITKSRKNNMLEIGWVGGYGGDHKHSLEKLLFPALMDLPFMIKLTILGVYNKSDLDFLFTHFKGNLNTELVIPLEIDWLNEVEIQNRIANFDIGIATLFDNEMHRSKSAFKAKQYLNNGIPVLSSDIKENNLYVKHGENGFLCSTSDDFRQRIIEINQMSQTEYLTMSKIAKKTATQFNLDVYCNSLIAFFRNQV
jgi:glycosyltransferase involved in cell wall biosynthesis